MREPAVRGRKIWNSGEYFSEYSHHQNCILLWFSFFIKSLSSSGTWSKWLFGIFETGIFFDFRTGTRTLQTAQVASSSADMDICSRNFCKSASFTSREIGAGQAGDSEPLFCCDKLSSCMESNRWSSKDISSLPLSENLASIPCWSRFVAQKLCRLSFVFFLFSRFRFLCWLTRTWRCSAVSFLRLDSVRSRSISSRAWRRSAVSFLRLESARSRSFSSRTWRCSAVSFIRLDRARSRSFSSRAWRCSSVSLFRFNWARSLLIFSWFWRCWSLFMVWIESARSTSFSSWCRRGSSNATVLSRISPETRDSWALFKFICSVRLRRFGEDGNSGIRTWVTALFLSVLFSGV